MFHWIILQVKLIIHAVMTDCAACNMYFLILFKVWTFNKLEKIYKQVADLAQCIYIILCITALLAHTGQTTSSLCTVL